ncbi:hypothetical protein AGMMS50218_00430 [Actinomycetota bacterium]|nr:hypothetical protein AGMMS50218_00430 [Actinomycetota bacterium]
MPGTVLLVGGTGRMSAGTTRLAVERGLDVHVLVRGGTTARPVPPGARVLHGDAHDPASVRAVLGGRDYDVVVQWVGYTAEQAQADLALFEGRTGHYVYISSASAYQTPPLRLPIVESTPLRNPFLQYSRDKIAAEEVLLGAYRDRGFPVTVVRPSHTYDRTTTPFNGGWTIVERMLQGREVVVHGDGTSLWTLTHQTDVARGLVPLLGDLRSVGQAVHITGDDVLTWDAIAHELARAAGVQARIVHVPSDVIAAHDPLWGGALLGDKAHSLVFDTSLLRRLVPGFTTTVRFDEGAREIVDWHLADDSRRVVDREMDALMDRLVERFRA